MRPQEIQQLLETGLSHHQAGRADEADAIYRRVLAAQPDNHDALHLLGMLEAQRGRHEQALALLRRATAIVPAFAPFHLHLGQTLATMGRHEEAIVSYARAVDLDPRDPLARCDAGISLMMLGRVAHAVDQLRIASELAPNDPVLLANYGFGLGKMGRLDEAIAILARAVAQGPQHPGPWTQYAEMLWRRGRYDEAVAPARRGVELAPTDPRALVLLGNTLQTVAGFGEAAELYRRAAGLEPNNPDAPSNLALTLLKMGEAQAALEMYEQVLTRWPTHTDALANRSLALLTLGNLRRGFLEYEARWKSPLLRKYNFPQPLWDGSDPSGKTILLVSEQGLGDTIQFVRYAPLVAARGAQVLLLCAADLQPLMQTIEGIAAIFTPADELPPFDAYAPLASLPGLFDTMLETIPAQVPYLRADADRIAKWRARLGDANVLKVGIVWGGSPAHQNDRSRSCTLADFAPLSEVEEVVLYSLQKGAAAAQVASPPAMRFFHLGEELNDFSDTAAVLECLDLLIAVDTSVVHLAGALARPVWTLLARGPDWRWMLERDDSPWYPTMRLLRQPRPGAWKPVFERAKSDLADLVHAQRKERS
jgi:Flp pilus assembly protein TadD